MLTSEEYSQFLNWDPNDPITADSVVPPFGSLAIGQYSPNPAAVNTLPFIYDCFSVYQFSNRLTLFSSKLIPRMLSTPHLQDLSVVDDQGILLTIILLLERCIWLASHDAIKYLPATSGTDAESVRNVVLHEVLLPIDPSLVQISRNPHLLSWSYECFATSILLVNIFDVGAFHQPVRDLLCSSHIPMAYQTHLSKVEYERDRIAILGYLSNRISKWKENGAEIWRGGRLVLYILEQEGFRNDLEQTLLHDNWAYHGRCVRMHAFEVLEPLGLNSPSTCYVSLAGCLAHIDVISPAHNCKSRSVPLFSRYTLIFVECGSFCRIGLRYNFIEMREDTPQLVCGVGRTHGDLCSCLVTMTQLGLEDFGWDEGSSWALLVASTFSAAPRSVTTDSADLSVVHPSREEDQLVSSSPIPTPPLLHLRATRCHQHSRNGNGSQRCAVCLDLFCLIFGFYVQHNTNDGGFLGVSSASLMFCDVADHDAISEFGTTRSACGTQRTTPLDEDDPAYVTPFEQSIVEKLRTAEGEERWRLVTQLAVVSSDGHDFAEELKKAENDAQALLVLSVHTIRSTPRVDLHLDSNPAAFNRVVEFAGHLHNLPLVAAAIAHIGDTVETLIVPALARTVFHIEPKQELCELVFNALRLLAARRQKEVEEGMGVGKDEMTSQIVGSCLKVFRMLLSNNSFDPTPFVDFLVTLAMTTDLSQLRSILVVLQEIEDRTRNTTRHFSLSTATAPFRERHQSTVTQQPLPSIVSSILLSARLDPFQMVNYRKSPPPTPSIFGVRRNTDDAITLTQLLPGLNERLITSIAMETPKIVCVILEERRASSSRALKSDDPFEISLAQENRHTRPQQLFIILHALVLPQDPDCVAVSTLIPLAPVLTRILSIVIPSTPERTEFRVLIPSEQFQLLNMILSLVLSLIDTGTPSTLSTTPLSSLLSVLSIALVRLDRIPSSLHLHDRFRNLFDQRENRSNPQLAQIVLALCSEGMEDRSDLALDSFSLKFLDIWKGANTQHHVERSELVPDGFPCDEELVSKASNLFSSINMTLKRNYCADEFLKATAQDSTGSAGVFFSAPRLRDLSVINDQDLMFSLISFLEECVSLSSPDAIHSLSATLRADPQSIRDVVLHEVLIPIEPSLVQICRNRHLLSWNETYHTFSLVSMIFDASGFHQPTLDFVCTSRIPMAFQSLLSKVEKEFPHQTIMYCISSNSIHDWKDDGGETWRRGRILLQTLEGEGFQDHLDQALFQDKSSWDGKLVGANMKTRSLRCNSSMAILDETMANRAWFKICLCVRFPRILSSAHVMSYGESEIVKMEAADCFEKSLRDLDWGAAVWFGWGTPKHAADLLDASIASAFALLIAEHLTEFNP
ncbi:hypothetical protein BLNAU_15844 [Blattamonas nauphoetae]|uniref:Uncharacterized protein n=1 Tax=Blattamonas nauphoetae TaxID=2049346 RepID=A0ABQ9XG48_9EUKA|nr:hypothetical protein BLNAU_15844 [Blattamonas nauphoetae]